MLTRVWKASWDGEKVGGVDGHSPAMLYMLERELSNWRSVSLG
jgi:hypothetical protein